MAKEAEDKTVKETVVDKVEDVSLETSNKDSGPSKAEAEAREMGWLPKDEYSGSKRWVDAEEFVERQELYDGIHKANRENKKLKKTVETLAKHNEDTYQAAYDNALKVLKAERKVAANNDDVKLVVELDEKIEEVQEQKAKAPKKAVDSTDEIAEVVGAWKEKNEWYREDTTLRRYANGLGNDIQEENPDWSMQEVLTEVAKQVKKDFPDKFENPNRKERKVGSPKPGNANDSNKNNKLPTFQDLPKEAQDMYRILVKTPKNPRGHLTAEKYLKDYALKAGIIKDEE